ncbi:MAG TPA: Pr6Pr family membrane protein [Sphingomicrobium sp.]|nr:Pr6Pr family membrane protein [Sphingomicrobium sp.]
MPRLAAALVALICWTGLGVRFALTYGENGDVLETLWILARFFTILSNLALAIVMTFDAFGRRLSDFLLGGLTLTMLLVGIVYLVLLQSLYQFSGASLFADVIMHRASPIAIALYWVIFAPHCRLRWSAPFWWSLFPLVYFGYALVRGSIENIYPYPFMDVGEIGIAQTAINAAVIAAVYIVVGLALVWLDRRVLGRMTLVTKAAQ